MIAAAMPPRRESEKPEPKVTLCGRVRPDVQEALEDIARGMRPSPSISQLVALAVEEFVERHGKSKSRN